MFEHLLYKADHASVGTTLILAGFIPSLFNSSTLQTIYFLLLIPPAAWHCYLWFKKAVIPSIQKLLKELF